MDQTNPITEVNTTTVKTETISSSTERPSEESQELLEVESVSESEMKSKSNLEELLFKSDEQQDHSLSAKIQTNLSTSQQGALSKEGFQEKQLNTIIAALEKVGLNDDYIMGVIKEGIESAVVQGPKGAILRDRPSIIKLVDKYLKLKKYYKSDTVINVLNAFANPGQLY